MFRRGVKPMRQDWYTALNPLIYSGFGYSVVRYLIYGILRRVIGKAVKLVLTVLVFAIALYLFVKYWQIPMPINLIGN